METEDQKAKRRAAMKKWKDKNPTYHAEWRRKHPVNPPNTDSSILRVCTACKSEMPATADYFETNKTRPLGLGSRCKSCLSKKSAAYNKSHRESAYANNKRWRIKNERKRTLVRRGLTPEKYDAMLQAQAGVCAICETPPKGSGKNGLFIDHNHVCCPRDKGCSKCVRGLLCQMCNHALERMESIPEWHEKAIRYLTRFALAKMEKEFK